MQRTRLLGINRHRPSTDPRICPARIRLPVPSHQKWLLRARRPATIRALYPDLVQLHTDILQSDIEALVERSFAMRETYFRRAYRQLAPAPLPSIKQPRRESRPQYFEEPQSPALTSESDACETVSDSEDDNHAHLERRSSYASSSSADTCLGLESARGLSSNTSLKTTSGSRTSWSSQSNNPFRKHGSAMSRSEGGSRSSDGDAGSMISFPSDGIWDGALIDLS